MADLNIRLDLRATPRMFRTLLVPLLLSGLAGELASESVSLTTYLPAPTGVYNGLITTGNTYLARDGGADPSATQTWVDVGMAMPGTSAAGNYKMAVMGGNVGIGTTNPGAVLDVGSTAAGIGIRYLKTGAADARITVGDPTHSWSLSSGWSVAGDLDVLEEGVNSFMHIKAGNGYVGIATTAPGALLDVNGTMIGRTWEPTTSYP